MKHCLTFLCCLMLGCHSTQQPSQSQLEKIQFDLSLLNEEGLSGPEGGKMAVDYEFCIPKEDKYLEEVKRIDPTVQVQTAAGRIGCNREQYLCLGNTHQKNHKKVLYQLSKLEYIDKINQAFFE